MLVLLTSAFILGLIFNAAPGAVFAETVRQGVRGGFRPALDVQLGSLVGDAVWAVLGLLGIGLLLQIDWLRWPIGIAGIVYLLWLAQDSWKSASAEFHIEAQGNASRRSALRSGMLLSLTNPQNIAYWAAMGSALGAVGVTEPTATDYGLFFTGFMLSSFIWCFVCAAIVDRVFRKAGMQWARATYRLCAIAFLVLALGSIRDLLAPVSDPTKAPPALSQPANGCAQHTGGG
ncbi:LysE family transporter [Halopseudomonas pelagia]|uniref:Chemotaxis protein n=1 Tax=Halopseudomonas pelagia TaxID=553151 RepID=A0AA91U525_9GAMM|nr:LysE family transporter [Halopseudomonas pelagia]PCD00529.1 chemotaxis protein [Halopseudomonas pelagia]QFY55232.1 chemotaxis protein [Halopseudomonas pelagia]